MAECSKQDKTSEPSGSVVLLRMAECSKQDKTSEPSGSADGFEEFCKNFSFLDTSTCSHCNGFYGPNCNQPLCISCHKFLFVSRRRKRLLVSNCLENAIFKYYRYAHSNSRMLRANEPSSSSSTMRGPLKLKDLNRFFSEFAKQHDDNEQQTKSSLNTIRTGCTSKNTVAGESSTCSATTVDSEVKSDGHISLLPMEILLKIFAHLNDISLIEVSRVSEQWKQILDTQQELWKKYTKRRWPLLQRNTEPTNWLKMYAALDSACFCRICANDVMQKGDSLTMYTKMRKRAERDRMARFEINGIRAVPLDGKMARWQASITGPTDSPYEGGTFFLDIYMPHNYPFVPPVIKFLTKIIHPNISRHGDIGLDIITWNYCLSLTINPILLSIQSLLCDPFTKVCMEPELGRLYDHDRTRFNALARHWTKKYAMMNEITFEN